jgi:DNA-binding NarL/FixJ family response regulator
MLPMHLRRVNHPEGAPTPDGIIRKYRPCPGPMKYLVVDDHTLIRDAMESVLASVDPGARVLTAGSGAQARTVLASEPGVDLVLLDLRLPDVDGLALLEELRSEHPAMAVVMLSGERDAATVRRALDAGAAGFIPKTEPREVLAGALSLVLAGGVYVPREALGAPPAPAAAGGGGPSPQELGLTDRQVDVLALIMKGRTNKHICRELNLAEPTVKNHVTAILRALKVGSRTEAVLAVTKLGWSLDPR